MWYEKKTPLLLYDIIITGIHAIYKHVKVTYSIGVCSMIYDSIAYRTCLSVQSVTQFVLQVTGNYSKIFSNCGVDLYMGNTLNDAISCLKMRIDLYTRLTYTRVYTVSK